MTRVALVLAVTALAVAGSAPAGHVSGYSGVVGSGSIVIGIDDKLAPFELRVHGSTRRFVYRDRWGRGCCYFGPISFRATRITKVSYDVALHQVDVVGYGIRRDRFTRGRTVRFAVRARDDGDGDALLVDIRGYGRVDRYSAHGRVVGGITLLPAG